MPTSVKLQDMESYSLIFMIIAIAVIALPIIIILILKLIRFEPPKRKPKPVKLPVAKKIEPQQLKSMYLEKVREIETRYTNNLIDLRQAHIDLSKTVREYCAFASNINTDKLTLREIAKLGKPALFDMVKEFYQPEFAYESDKDINMSFWSAREVIRTWA